MNRAFLTAFLGVSPLFSAVPQSPSTEAADQALKRVEADVGVLEHDLIKFVSDVIKYVFLRAPSGGTLVSDAIVDASLRKVPAFDKFIKELENTNPTNGAVARDGSKSFTIFWKKFLGIPVDQKGRLYDISDVLTQSSKFGFKGLSFLVAAYAGYIDNPMLVFVLNTAGDIGSQVFQEVGENWRHQGGSQSYLAYFSKHWRVGLKSSIDTIPVKSAVGSIVGSGIKWFELDYKVGNFTEFVCNRTVSVIYFVLPNNLRLRDSLYWVGNSTVDTGNWLGAPDCTKNVVYFWGNCSDWVLDRINEVSGEELNTFTRGWVIEFTRAIIKSLFLTTGCKVGMDITRQLKRNPMIDSYVSPAILVLVVFSMGTQSDFARYMYESIRDGSGVNE